MLETYDLGWNAARHCGVRNIAYNTRPRADECARADRRPRRSTCPNSKTSETTNLHISGQRAPRADMCAFGNSRIVIDQGAGVDNRKIADRRRGVHDRASHDGDAPAESRRRGDNGGAADRINNLEPDMCEIAPDRNPTPVVAKRDECLVDSRPAKSNEIAVGADHLYAQNRPWGRIGVDQTDNLIATLGLDQLDNDLRVAAGANNDNRLNAHIRCWVSHFKPCFPAHRPLR